MTLLYFAAFFAVLGIVHIVLPYHIGMTGVCLLLLAAVLAALDGKKPVCGVLQQADSAFLRRVAAHPRVRVVTVTEENRDTLRHQLRIEK